MFNSKLLNEKTIFDDNCPQFNTYSKSFIPKVNENTKLNPEKSDNHPPLNTEKHKFNIDSKLLNEKTIFDDNRPQFNIDSKPLNKNTKLNFANFYYINHLQFNTSSKSFIPKVNENNILNPEDDGIYGMLATINKLGGGQIDEEENVNKIKELSAKLEELKSREKPGYPNKKFSPDTFIERCKLTSELALLTKKRKEYLGLKSEKPTIEQSTIESLYKDALAQQKQIYREDLEFHKNNIDLTNPGHEEVYHKRIDPIDEDYKKTMNNLKTTITSKYYEIISSNQKLIQNAKRYREDLQKMDSISKDDRETIDKILKILHKAINPIKDKITNLQKKLIKIDNMTKKPIKKDYKKWQEANKMIEDKWEKANQEIFNFILKPLMDLRKSVEDEMELLKNTKIEMAHISVPVSTHVKYVQTQAKDSKQSIIF